MSLEAGDGFVSGLVVTNPVNATDQVAQGDDHIRLIKTALKGTFPNLTGAVTATQAELNALDGITASVAELNILDGVTLTAAQINDAARLSVANTFSSSGNNEQRIQTTGATKAAWSSYYSNSLAKGAVGVTGSGGDALISGATLFDLSLVSYGVGISLSGDSGTTLHFRMGPTGNYDFKAGTVTTDNASASEIGYKGVPQNAQNGDYTLVLTDAGKTIYKASGGAGETITIPANGSVAFPVGTIVRVVNRGGGTLSIAITSDALELAGSGTTGTRTLSDKGVAVLEKVEATIWMISGAGVS